MNHKTYAMDTHFFVHNAGPTLAEQCRMVKDAGYDDYFATIPLEDADKVPSYSEECRRTGLGLSGVYLLLNIQSGPDEEKLPLLTKFLENIQPPTRLELAMHHGNADRQAENTSLESNALKWLEQVNALAAPRGIEVCLYPHFDFWIETLSDALRLSKLAGPLVDGVVFCAYHWYRVGKEKDLDSLLDTAGKQLRSVNLNGSRFLAPNEAEAATLNPTIEPLDAGTLDNAAILRSLKRIGYAGPIGIQGYGVNASAPEALARSRRKLAELLAV